MATARSGYTDALHQARLDFLTGTTHPAAPAGNYLSLYMNSLPLSDGTGGTEATGTRPSITLGSSTQDGNGRWYKTNTSAITNIQLTNANGGEVVGYGICSASTAGTLNYVDRLHPFPIKANALVSIPAGAIKVYAETTLI